MMGKSNFECQVQIKVRENLKWRINMTTMRMLKNLILWGVITK
jgi:hypothetical protein